MQITGGYYADPGLKDVPHLASCGYPIAEVAADGSATITKLDQAGGVVNLRTVKEQLLYEVHGPTSYLTPDVTADFSAVRLAETGRDRVAVSGASGRQRPDMLKVTVGFDGGYVGEAGISYAGRNAYRRAVLARDILLERLSAVCGLDCGLRIDLIGHDSLHATAGCPSGVEATVAPFDEDSVRDIRVRVAARTLDRDVVEMLLWEVESLLCCGPAGGGGFRGRVSPSVITYSALIPRAWVSATCRVVRV